MKQGIYILLIFLLLSCTERQNKQLLIANSDGVSVNQENTELFSDSVFVQECLHKNLFKRFNVKVEFTRYLSLGSQSDSCYTKVTLTDKAGHFMDSLAVISRWYFNDAFKDCNQIMSYSTNVNTEMKIEDGYYGDIVVADFNFDGHEDLALIKDSGFKSPLYNFYIQHHQGRFQLDAFLTDSMMYFPEIDKKGKTLKTYGISGACHVFEYTYQTDKLTHLWRQTSKENFDICKDSVNRD